MRFEHRFLMECLCIVALSGGLSACTKSGDDDSGSTQTGTGGVGATGTGGMVATGTGGMTASGTGGMTASGTGGMTASGTGGTTPTTGSGGMGAVGTGGMTSDDDGGTTMGGGTGGTGGGTPAEMCIAAAAAKTPPRTGACTECGCNKCLDKLMNCTDDACDSIVACAVKNHCKGRNCYCGDQTAIACATGTAMGPCMMEIATASGLCGSSPDTCAQMLAAVADSTNAMYDANNPVTRANAVGLCTQGQDAAPAEGGGVVPAVMAVMGMCETECNQ